MKKLNKTQEKQLGIFTRFMKRNYLNSTNLKDVDQIKKKNNDEYFTLSNIMTLEIKGLELEENNREYLMTNGNEVNKDDIQKQKQLIDNLIVKLDKQLNDENKKEINMTLKELKMQLDNYSFALTGLEVTSLDEKTFINSKIIKQVYNLFNRFNQKEFKLIIATSKHYFNITPIVIVSENFRILVAPVRIPEKEVKKIQKLYFSHTYADARN